MFENLPDIFERHALDFRVAEIDCNPTKEADLGNERVSDCFIKNICGKGGDSHLLTAA